MHIVLKKLNSQHVHCTVKTLPSLFTQPLSVQFAWLLSAHCSRQSNHENCQNELFKSILCNWRWSILFNTLSCFPSTISGLDFYTFIFFTQKQETLQHSVRTLQSSELLFIFFFLRLLLHSHQCLALVHSNWIERSAFNWSAKYGELLNRIEMLNIVWPQKSNLMWKIQS